MIDWENFAETLFIGLIVTVVAYGAGPLIFCATRSTAKLRTVRIFCLVYTLLVSACFSLIDIRNGGNGSSSAWMLWGFIFYKIVKKKLVPPESIPVVHIDVDRDKDSPTLGQASVTPYCTNHRYRNKDWGTIESFLSSTLCSMNGEKLQFKYRTTTTFYRSGNYELIYIFDSYIKTGRKYSELFVCDECTAETTVPPIEYRFAKDFPVQKTEAPKATEGSQSTPVRSDGATDANEKQRNATQGDLNSNANKKADAPSATVSNSYCTVDSSKGTYVKVVETPDPIIPKEVATEMPQTEIRFCRNCRANLIPNSRFCNQCGTSVAEGPEFPKCAHCGTVIPENSKFCPFCGEKIEVNFGPKCTNCGNMLPEDSLFCHFCGTEIRPVAIEEPAQKEKRRALEEKERALAAREGAIDAKVISLEEKARALTAKEEALKVKELAMEAKVAPSIPVVSSRPAKRRWLRVLIPIAAIVVVGTLAVVLLLQKGGKSLIHHHNYESRVTKSATCSVEGKKLYHCVECGYEYYETIKSKGHSYTLITNSPATATKEGYKTYCCSVCYRTYSETIPKLKS